MISVKLFFVSTATLKKLCFRLLLLAAIIAAAVLLIPKGIRYIEVISHRYHPIYAVETEEKAVALTFDISWGSAMAPKVLQILREHQVTATFFLSGPWVESHAELAGQILADGHEIGSHGHKHVNFSQLSKEQIIDNVMSAHNSIKNTLNVEPSLIRTPNGDFDDETILTIKELGYLAIDWMIDSLDWKNPGVNAIINRVVKRLQPGAIILMHASDSCKMTDAALPAIIKEARSAGYQFVKVSDLLKLGPNDTKIR